MLQEQSNSKIDNVIRRKENRIDAYPYLHDIVQEQTAIFYIQILNIDNEYGC